MFPLFIIPSFLQVTGEPLVQRADDNPATVKPRLEAFHKQTIPVLGYYEAQHKLARINADDSIKGVWANVQAALDKK